MVVKSRQWLALFEKFRNPLQASESFQKCFRDLKKYLGSQIADQLGVATKLDGVTKALLSVQEYGFTGQGLCTLPKWRCEITLITPAPISPTRFKKFPATLEITLEQKDVRFIPICI